MMSRVWEKVEYVRSQPEHIRMRYVFGCLAVSMLFIMGIWMLSLRESFSAASEDLSFPQEKAFLENMGGVPSLQDLLNDSTPLQVENEVQPMTGEEYFLNQYNQGKQSPAAGQNSGGGNLEGEGVNPNQR